MAAIYFCRIGCQELWPKMRIFNGLYILCRWALGGIFIYAGSSKLLEPEVFAVLIDAFGIVPEALLMPVALTLPALEVVAGIGLLLGIPGSLPTITGMLILFIAILGYGIGMGLDVDCGCFGPEDPEAKAFHGMKLSLWRDLLMLAGVAYVYGWQRFKKRGALTITGMMNKLFRKRRTEDVYG